MSPAVVAFLFAAGASAWIYSKLVHSTGNANPSQVIAATGISGVIIFILFWIGMRALDGYLGQ